MEAFLIAYMAPIMFAALVVFLLLGYPVAFSLGAVGLIFAFVGIELGEFQPNDYVHGQFGSQVLDLQPIHDEVVRVP